MYRAVQNRCAVDFDTLKLPIGAKESLEILKHEGFEQIEVDLVKKARERVGISTYRRGAQTTEAPETFDCSSFVKWLYGLRGIWLPRRSIQQRQYGESVTQGELDPGDIVFTSGWIDYFFDDPTDGVGHVGIATGEGTVIHAANRKLGVIESKVENFTTQKKFRGARRVIAQDKFIPTLLTPAHREVETSDDIRWIILQKLPRT